MGISRATQDRPGGGTVRAAQPSTPSVIPHRNSGPGIIAGPKWTAWSETIATARHEGKEELAQILGKSATNSLSQGTMGGNRGIEKGRQPRGYQKSRTLEVHLINASLLRTYSNLRLRQTSSGSVRNFNSYPHASKHGRLQRTLALKDSHTIM
uniref:Uncharacterized protein n=1 Tax=Haemonchus contortus TaxID=6289 RepID=W6NH20_HAECO